MIKTIALGADNAGLALKDHLATFLREQGYHVDDFGCFNDEPVDYPDVAVEVARSVSHGDHERAILVCGTGIGMAITANKVEGVRAAVAHDVYSAERARGSNDAQVLALGARVVGLELAEKLVATWLSSEFDGGASGRKVDKIRAVESRA